MKLSLLLRHLSCGQQRSTTVKCPQESGREEKPSDRIMGHTTAAQSSVQSHPGMDKVIRYSRVACTNRC